MLPKQMVSYRGLCLFIWAAFALTPDVYAVFCVRQVPTSNETLTNNLGSQDVVIDLPGQPEVGFLHYAGYVTVNEKNGRALFYWFFEATDCPDEKPLVLWLNGGPGCSSVGYGATQEIGPFLVDTDGHGLKLNTYSWNTEANLLFLESPAGVGFSYSNTTTDYNILGDGLTANDTYNFLHEWYKKFPTFRNQSFYIAGESYAGKYVPELAELIYDMNNDSTMFINLKGFLLGNPETSDGQDWQGFVDYAWSHAIVSDTVHKMVKENCNFYSDDTWRNKSCKEAVDEVLKQYKHIDMYSLYTPVCSPNSTSSDAAAKKIMFRYDSKMETSFNLACIEDITVSIFYILPSIWKFHSANSIPNTRGQTVAFEDGRWYPAIWAKARMPRLMSNSYDPCLDNYAKTFYNRQDVQKALHVCDGQRLVNWSICNMQVFDEWKDSNPSVLPIYKKLIAGGLRIWVYSGDTDGRVPVLSTRYALSDLGLPLVGSWKPWYHQKQVSGWLQEYEGLTFATFRGAGHAVPLFQPSHSLAFFASFLAGDSSRLCDDNV